MVLVIDTSSSRSTVALLEGYRLLAEQVADSGRAFDVAAVAARVLDGRTKRLTMVAVALGPGSFTGMRAGISFGLGLARGLEIPIHGLGTLALVAARARRPATCLSEAGRGRVYFLTPEGRTGIAEAGELPTVWPLLGAVRAATADALLAAGHSFLAEVSTLSFGEAAATLLEGSKAVAYDRVRPVYMSPFGGLAEGPA